MRVLVAYATRHGATAGIAERIATTLRSEGLSADAVPVEKVRDLSAYDAVVVGSAAYMLHWLKEARAFVKHHEQDLRERPVWLFSSGPLGTDEVDKEGRDVREGSRPREFERYARELQPRGEHIFFGAWDPEQPAIGIGERMMGLAPKARAALPSGDFRDWPEIEAWARGIAAELGAAAPR